VAHKKGAGSSRNGRDSNAKRLGIKHFGGEYVIPGNIIVRQRGTHFHAHIGVGIGRDYTIYAKTSGFVEFCYIRGGRRAISVVPIPRPIMKEITLPQTQTRQIEFAAQDGHNILTLQMFKDGFYSACWPTEQSINGFIQLMNTLLAEKKFASGFSTPDVALAPIDEQDVSLRGVVVSTTKTRHQFKLDWPLSAKLWEATLKPDEKVRQIRVNTYIGDFGFMVKADKASLGEMAVMSHVNLTPLIIQLFRQTRLSDISEASIGEIEKKLHERLRNYRPFRS
jgi:large subunit ribosomal protein L27